MRATHSTTGALSMSPRSLRSLLSLLLLALGALVPRAQASVYPIESKLWIPPFQHAEKLFASDRGPIFARHGASTIQLRVDGVNVTEDMDNWRMVVLIYHAETFATLGAVEDKLQVVACAAPTARTLTFPGMAAVQREVFPVRNESVHAVVHYQVNVSGWTDTRIFVCSDANGAAEVLPFRGTMEIRNPFGLLPAVLYGMMPFSSALAVGYFVLLAFFAVLVCRHRQQALHLHYGILGVMVMGFAATSAWFYAFVRMNQTGEPVCCPYPTTFLVAVLLDTLMRTLARLLLIVVCLGYGIVRNTLRRGEVALIVLLSLAYFVSGVGDEVTRGTSSGVEFRQKPTAWSFVQLLCNLMFIMWIHFSLERILKQLDEQKQSAKLGMYKSLAWALGGFIVFFSVLTLIAVCSHVGVFDWDVEWEWMQLVSWPMLNFIVSAAMCVIWRPTKNSSQFAFSMQLPMHEDAECGVELPNAFSRDSDDDDGLYGGDITIDSDEDGEVEVELSPPKDAVLKGKATTVAGSSSTMTGKGQDHDGDDADHGL